LETKRAALFSICRSARGDVDADLIAIAALAQLCQGVISKSNMA